MTTYWVDADSGDNGNSGLTKLLAWATIAYAITQVSAGDTITLVGGDTYASRVVYDEEDLDTQGLASGSSGNEIVITNETDKYVEVSSSVGTDTIFNLRQDYWQIIGQEFDPFDTDTPSNPYFLIDRKSQNHYAVYVNGGSYITLQYLEIAHGDRNPALVHINNAASNTVSYCRIHDNIPDPGTDHNGVQINSSDSGTPSDDNVIEYCHIYDVAGDCIQLDFSGSGTCDAVIVRYCTLLAHSTPAASENAVDIKIGDGALVYGNVMSGFRDCDGSVGGSGSDGQAILIQSDAQNTEVYSNTIYDISGAAIRCDADGVVFRNNVIHSLVDEASIGEQSVLNITSGAQNVEVYHNVVDGSYEGVGNSYKTSVGATVTLKNNIFYDCNTVSDSGTTTASNNCWYSCVGSVSGSGDITSDPQFTNQPGNVYTLTVPSSPAIDAGTDVALPYNGSAPDMGAFESVGVISVSDSVSVAENVAAYTEGDYAIWYVSASDEVSVGESIFVEAPTGYAVVYVSGAHVVVSGAHVVIGV